MLKHSATRVLIILALACSLFAGSAALADSCSATKTCYKMRPGQCSITSPANGSTLCYNSSTEAVCISYSSTGKTLTVIRDACTCYSETFCEAFPWRCAPECL